MKDPLTLLLLSLLSIVMTSLLEQCDITTITKFPDVSGQCCNEEGEWLIRRDGEYECEPIPCIDLDENNTLLYEDECRDVFEDGVCGEEAVGERLYLGEDGRGWCNCEEGWVRYEGRCYQEFTPAFCPGNTILRLTPPEMPKTGKWITPDQLAALRLNISCMENPCQPSYLPHASTWSELEPVCHEVVENLEGCEVVVEGEDGMGPLRCCHPINREACYSNSGLTLFSVTLNCAGNCSCTRDKIWSKYIQKCVDKYLD